MIPSSPFIFFPSRPTVPLEHFVQVLRKIQFATELEEQQNNELITRQEAIHLFAEQKEGCHVYPTDTERVHHSE